MARTLRIALAQYTVPEDPAEARTSAERAIREAAGRGARMVVLPEASMTPFGTHLFEVATTHAAVFEELVTTLAAELDVVVIAGSFEVADASRVHNVALVRGPGLRADYRKIHLYDAFGSRESETVAPGEGLVQVEVDGIGIGVATCYDVRFPEQFVALAQAGAQIITLPMAWGDGPGKAEQLRVLLRARALDSTCVVLAADQLPPQPAAGRAPRGVGGSVALTPLGQVIAEVGPQENVLVTDIDTSTIDEARAALPVLDPRPTITLDG